MPGDFDFNSDEPKPKRRPRDDEDRDDRPKKRRPDDDDDEPRPKKSGKRDSDSDDNPFADADEPAPKKAPKRADEPVAKPPVFSDDNPFANEEEPPRPKKTAKREEPPPAKKPAKAFSDDNPFATDANPPFAAPETPGAVPVAAVDRSNPFATDPEPVTKRRRADDDDDDRPKKRHRNDDDDDDDRRGSRANSRHRGDKKKSPLPIIIAVGLVGVLVVGGLVTAIVILATGGNSKDTSKDVAKDTSKDKPKTASKADDKQPEKKELVGATSPTKDVVDRVTRNTVYIEVIYPGGKTGGSGSGFVERESKLIITNAHVLGDIKKKFREPEAIQLTFNSGSKNEYKLLGVIRGVDPDADLAAIEVLRNPNVSVVIPEGITVARKPKLDLLQPLCIFGFPLGYKLGAEISVTTTTISSIRKDAIQVNGGMTHGNSGGPVVDLRGNVVGVAVAIIKDTQINFAIPSDTVHDFLTKEKLR